MYNQGKGNQQYKGNEQYYEGDLICGKLVSRSLYKFRLQKQKLIYFDKEGKRLGIFHMAITQINYDRQKQQIMIDSGTQQFYLKCQGPQFQLNQWYKKLKEAQQKAKNRQKQYYRQKQFQQKNLKQINDQIFNSMNLLQTHRSNTQQKYLLLNQKLQNYAQIENDWKLLYDSLILMREHLGKLMQWLRIQKQYIFNSISKQDKKFIVQKKIQNYNQKKQIRIQDQNKLIKIRQYLPDVKQNSIKLVYSEILKNFKNYLFQQIRFPILAYQPLSFLQRLAQQFQYYDLLNKADNNKQPIMRIAYVMAFSLSSYHNQKRRLKLPFQNIENQTFTYNDEKNQIKIICKSKSTRYFHAQVFVQGKNFQINQQTKLIGKYYGNSFEFRTSGPTRIKLKNTGDIIQYNRPHIVVQNILTNPQIDLLGTLNYIYYKNDKAELEGQFLFTGQKNGIAGTIRKASATDKTPLHQLKGIWDQQISIFHVQKKRQELLWRIPENQKYQKRFNLSRYALQLNYLPLTLVSKLDPTDSRFRKDIKYLEEGKIKSCQQEKQKLQRQKLKTYKKSSTINLTK